MIDLAAAREARMAHLSGQARCLACKHEWVAVAPTGAHRLECPACGTMRGVWNYPVTTHDAAGGVWQCGTCKGDLFVLSDRQLMCVCCGEYQVGWWNGQDPDG